MILTTVGSMKGTVFLTSYHTTCKLSKFQIGIHHSHKKHHERDLNFHFKNNPEAYYENNHILECIYKNGKTIGNTNLLAIIIDFCEIYEV